MIGIDENRERIRSAMGRWKPDRDIPGRVLFAALLVLSVLACSHEREEPVPNLKWYVFDEQSGAFLEAAKRCGEASAGKYIITLTPLPADAEQQREQLARRLASGDPDIDIIGMDVIWTAEFAEAGWILPWEGAAADRARRGRLHAPLESARYRRRLWAAPFTANAQLLWYRKDRFPTPPKTWDELIRMAETTGRRGAIEIQGQRYEGLTVLFVSLLASAGGTVLDETATRAALPEEPTRKTLRILRRIANSRSSDPNLSSIREDEARLAFETGLPAFMVNYSFVWPSALRNAPELARNTGWSRWPSVIGGSPSRVAAGGINLGIGAFTLHPDLAFHAAACLASAPNQRLAAGRGGLPPSVAALYDDPGLRDRFPFADVLRETLIGAVQRPQTPLYADVSLAISRTLHPLRDIDPERDVYRLRVAIDRALRSEGLL